MAHATRIAIVLWVLAAGALAGSLLAPEREPEGWFSYVPLSSEEIRTSNGTGHPALDPTLWLGISIGLATAGLLVLVLAHGRRPS